MSNLAQALALANEEAENGVDLNEVVAGGGGGRLLPVGYAFGRLIEYIEFGMQPQEFKGEKKQPAKEFQIGFALWGQTATGEKYHNDDGTPYIIRPYNIALHAGNEKAGSHKLFKLLNWDKTAKNYAQLLGKPYLVKIHHVEKSKTDKTIVSRIDLAGFLPANDPVTGAPYPVPEAPDDLIRLFLFDRPTKAGWDKLYIEGQYEAKDGKPAASKNRLQETILGATNYQGSALQLLLEGGAVLSAPTVAPEVAAPAAPLAVAAAPAVAIAAAPASVPTTPPTSPVTVTPAPSVGIAPTPAVSAPVSSLTTSPSDAALAVAAPAVAAIVAPVAAVLAPAPVLPV